MSRLRVLWGILGCLLFLTAFFSLGHLILGLVFGTLFYFHPSSRLGRKADLLIGPLFFVPLVLSSFLGASSEKNGWIIAWGICVVLTIFALYRELGFPYAVDRYDPRWNGGVTIEPGRAVIFPRRQEILLRCFAILAGLACVLSVLFMNAHIRVSMLAIFVVMAVGIYLYRHRMSQAGMGMLVFPFAFLLFLILFAADESEEYYLIFGMWTVGYISSLLALRWQARQFFVSKLG